MVKKIYYEKVGRKYVPVAEYDSDLTDSFGKGIHLVICYPGGQSRRYNIDPDYASELRPATTPITPAQQRAWKKLAKEFGTELCTLNGASSWEIAQAGLKALEQEAANLLTNAAVKAAYDQFLFVCALTKQQRK